MKGYARRYFALIMAACMMLFSVPFAHAEQTGFVDMPGEGHWSYAALNSAVENGILSGNNNHLYPNRALTRAQMAAIINRVFGAKEQADISAFQDVKAGDWFSADLAKAVCMGTFQGNGNMLYPNRNIKRQEVMAVLARTLKLDTADTSNLDNYQDSDQIADYAKGAVAAMLRSGYVSGYADNTIRPQNSLTREQMAQILYNIFQKYVNTAGTYTGDEAGNVMVNVPEVTIKDASISGDLIIGDGVGSGTVTLDHVTVSGRVLVRGGGENSLRIVNNSNIGSIIVTKSSSGDLRILSSQGARVDMVYVDDGKDTVTLEGTFKNVAVQGTNEVVLRNSSVTQLSVSAPGADVTVESGSVANTIVAESAAKAELTVGKNAKMGTVNVATNAAVDVSGSAAHIVISSGEQGSPSVSLKDGASVTTLEVKKNSAAKVEADDSAKVSHIVAVDPGSVTVGGSTAKKQELNDKISQGSAANSGGSGGFSSGGSSSGGSSGGSSSGGSDSGTVVTSFAQLKAAAADQAVTAISISGELEINDDFQCDKPVTIQNGAVVLISDYAIFFDSLTNNGTITTKASGRLHIGYQAAFLNKGKAQNNGVWYIYGALKNEGTYIAKNRRSGVINAFSGSFLIGMPETTVFAVYGDCYYADGTFRKSDQATDIQTDRNITLRTSGAVLSAFAFGQEGYDQAVKSDTAYEGLYLIADKEENNTLRLSPKYTGPEWLTFIGDGVTARVSNGTAAPGVLEVYGTLEIAAGNTLRAPEVSVQSHGTIRNQGDYQVETTYMFKDSAAFGMDGAKVHVCGDNIDYYYADGSVEKGGAAVTITGNADISSFGYHCAYIYGQTALENALASGIAYDEIHVCCDPDTPENNHVILNKDVLLNRLEVYEGASLTIAENTTLTAYLNIEGGVVENQGTIVGLNMRIGEEGRLINYGTVDLSKYGTSRLVLWDGTLDNRGTIDARNNTLTVSQGRGHLLNIPASICVTIESHDFYSNDGTIDENPAEVIVTGGAAVKNTASATAEGTKGLNNYLAAGKSYDEVYLHIVDKETVELPRSLRVHQVDVRDDSTLIVLEGYSLTVDEWMGVYEGGTVSVQNGGYLSADELSVQDGGLFKNDGTVTCDRLEIRDSSYYDEETGEYEEGRDAAFLNHGKLTAASKSDVRLEGEHSRLVHDEAAYFACYGNIRLDRGALLEVHGPVNPRSSQDNGFYCERPVQLYSCSYGGRIFTSRIISDEPIEADEYMTAYAATEADLRAALKAGATDIAVTAPMTLTADLELSTGQNVNPMVEFSELTVPGGVTLTASAFWGCDTLNIEGGRVEQRSGSAQISQLSIQAGGTLQISAEARLWGLQEADIAGTIVNEGGITIEGTYDYSSMPDLSWADSIPGTVEKDIRLRVYSLKELETLLADHDIAESVSVQCRSTAASATDYVIDHDLDFGSRRVYFAEPVTIDKGVTVKGARIQFGEGLHLYGTLDSPSASFDRTLTTEAGSCIRVSDWTCSRAAAQINGMIDLAGGRIYFTEETTFGESMQLQWHSQRAEDGDLSALNRRGGVVCSGVIHQLGHIEIPKDGEMALKGKNAYYEVIGSLTNQGEITIEEESSLYINNNARLNNEGRITNDGTLKIQALGLAVNSGTILNRGTIQINEGGTLSNVDGTITDEGTVEGTVTENSAAENQQAAETPEESRKAPEAVKGLAAPPEDGESAASPDEEAPSKQPEEKPEKKPAEESGPQETGLENDSDPTEEVTA